MKKLTLIVTIAVTTLTAIIASVSDAGQSNNNATLTSLQYHGKRPYHLADTTKPEQQPMNVAYSEEREISSLSREELEQAFMTLQENYQKLGF